MIRKVSVLLFAICLAMGVASCKQRTDKSSGTVLLSITDFNELPTQVSVNQAASDGAIMIGQVTLRNIPKDPNGTTSDLQSVELKSYEVTYSRADSGTRLPPPRTRSIFGLVPVGGTLDITNLDVLGTEQLLNPPVSDLLFQNGGFDTETGSPLIVLNVNIRFFGRTIAGDEVATGFDSFTLELVP